MKVLGIDPGMTAKNPLGAALLDGATLLETWEFRPARGRTGYAQMEALHPALDAILRDHLPDLVACEGAHGSVNLQAALKLAHLGGMVRALSLAHGIPFVLVEPSQGKKALTGRGRAEKQEVMDAVYQRFGVALDKDAADAVGSALAGLLLWQSKG